MEYAADTRTGLVRQINQDNIVALSNEEMALFAVADGMGGHSDGEKASEMIADTLKKWWKYHVLTTGHRDFFKMVTSIKEYLESANRAIYETYNRAAICGSTVSVLLIYQTEYAIFHVGDSRIYKLEKRAFRQMTVDEVWENDIKTRQKFTFSEIVCSKKRGKLVNAMGTTPVLSMSVKTDTFSKGTLFLLCSDGLYKMVRSSYMAGVLKKVSRGLSVYKGLEALLKKVYLAGAKDNVSIIIVKP